MQLQKCMFHESINQSFWTPPLMILRHTMAMKKLQPYQTIQTGTVINGIVITRHTHLSSIIDHIISFTVTMLSSSPVQSTVPHIHNRCLENVPALSFCTHAWVNRNRVQIFVFIYSKERHIVNTEKSSNASNGIGNKECLCLKLHSF